MTLKLSPKNPRVALDEMGNEVFIFTGDNLEYLRQILATFNSNNGKRYRRKDVQI